MTAERIRYAILALVVAVAAFALYHQYQATRPCAEPITYSIASIDPRFNLSSPTALAEAEAAAAIWNAAAGKTLLEYSPQGEVGISFVYDSRQSLAKLGAQIAEEQAASEEEREQIEAERPSVTWENAVAFNAEVASYNASVASLNQEIASYDSQAGGTFEEGEYTQDSSGRRITIYEFIGTSQLERVLAHEFGHALGLGHNNDPASIMYAENESGNLTPTAEDLTALKAVCGSQIRVK
ncbi:MAG TPA: matrixin family metalloprotease [Candidatus Paceibacterota bacterium]|nr:matrixin family metalloprotease [Candidatus Paceibacterota bacterium]